MAEGTTLDARGMLCPLPVLRARKVLRTLKSGDVLTLLATDPGAVRDVDALCEATGHVLLDLSEDAGELSFRIRKT
jgi:tRNA 2-thiouridine synthesizing protein A